MSFPEKNPPKMGGIPSKTVGHTESVSMSWRNPAALEQTPWTNDVWWQANQWGIHMIS